MGSRIRPAPFAFACRRAAAARTVSLLREKREHCNPPPHDFLSPLCTHAYLLPTQVVRGVVVGLPTATQAGSAVFSSACFRCARNPPINH